MPDTLFLSVLNMSITASLAILVVLLVRPFLKKAPKIYSYALWAVVLFRLTCPFSFESAIGLLPLSKTPIPHDIVYRTEPQINTGLQIADQVINPLLPAPNNMGESINPLQIWVFFGSITWVIGLMAMLIYSSIHFVRLKCRLTGSTPFRKNIHLADHISAPFVMGFIKPKIYLPSSMAENEQEFIIAHEQCHIKRFDHVIRILAFIALTIHWFNPLVWLAFILSGKDMEMSCDETVMKKMGTDIRPEYSKLLLRFATGKKFITAPPLAFGEGDTKDRVKNVMQYKKPMMWVSIVAVIAVIFVAAGLLSNPKAEPIPIETKGNTLADFEAIKIGTEKDKILEQFGEPNGTLSGMHGDIYTAGDKQIIIYYGFKAEGGYPVEEVKISDYIPKSLTHDQAVALALTSTSNGYLEGECIAMGHIILGYDDSDENRTKIYALTTFGWYGFENSNFVKVSGSGIIPALVTLDRNNAVEIEYPLDGSDYRASIENMFPSEYHSRIFGSDDNFSSERDELTKQEQQYAKEYLSKIGRNSNIGNHSDFEYTPLTHAGVSAEASNKLELFYKEHNYYPSFIGTCERLESGTRMVYETSYHKSQDEIRFTKYDYDTKEIVEQFTADAKTGEIYH